MRLIHMIDQLKMAGLPFHSHLIYSEPLDRLEWICLEKPYLWKVIKIYEDIQCLEDKGWGYKAIFKAGKLLLVAKGKEFKLKIKALCDANML